MTPAQTRFVPADLVDIVTRLEEWATEQRLCERATEHCRMDLKRSVADQWEGWERLDGYDIDTVEIKFFRQMLTFQRAGLNIPSVAIECMLFPTPRDTAGPIGSYRFSVRLDGFAIGGFLTLFAAPAAEQRET